jgi:citrate synthase
MGETPDAIRRGARDRGVMTTIDHASVAAHLRACGFVGRIVEPTDCEYDSARAGWNGAIDRHPAAVAYATDADDVAAATACAKSSHPVPIGEQPILAGCLEWRRMALVGEDQVMQIGQPGEPVSRIARAYPDRVEVRGRDLTGDLMGRLTFTGYFHLLLTGEEPTEEQEYFLDLLLVSIAEHGLMPTNVAARMTLAADPGSLQGAVAAGILGCGSVVLGTAEECARLLEAAQGKVASGRSLDDVASGAAREIHSRGERVPGFGHPVHRPLDPRAERILELADERGVSGPYVAFARALRESVAGVWGQPLTMNVSLPIAAVMLDLGFPASAVKAVPILARTAGLLAHLTEEQREPIGFAMAAAAEEAVAYEPPDGSPR